MKQQIEQIAKKHFTSVQTLETRQRDSLDFHSVHIRSIVDALTEAYESGRRSAEKRQKNYSDFTQRELNETN